MEDSCWSFGVSPIKDESRKEGFLPPELRGLWLPLLLSRSFCVPCSMHFTKRWPRRPSSSRANSEVTMSRNGSSRAGELQCWSRTSTGVTRSVAGDGQPAGQQSSCSKSLGGSHAYRARGKTCLAWCRAWDVAAALSPATPGIVALSSNTCVVLSLRSIL